MPIENITAPKFFEHLSEVNYNMNFRIDLKKDGKYTVAEETKPDFVDQFVMWLRPSLFKTQSPNEIEAQAQTLVDLFTKHRKDLETNANYKPAVIADNIARKATEIAETIDPASAEKVQKKFSEAIALLTDAKDKAAVKWYSENLGHPDVPAEAKDVAGYSEELGPDQFYKAFGRTGWIRGFDQRVHVIKNTDKNSSYFKPYLFYTSPRLSTMDRWLGSTDKIVAPAKKLANLTNLADAVEKDLNYIVQAQFNVSGMIANAKSLKGGRVTRNTNDVQANAINAQIDRLIRGLVAARKAIQEKNDSTFTARAWRFTKNWVVLPVHNVTTKPLYDYTIGVAINKTSEAASTAWGWTGGAVVDAVVGVKESIKKVTNA